MTKPTKTIASREVDIQIGEAFAKEENVSLAIREPEILAEHVAEPELPEDIKYIGALAKEEIKDKQQARSAKRKIGKAHVDMSQKTFWLSAGWCAFVAVAVVLVGLQILLLSENIVIALITSAALAPVIKSLSGWFNSTKDK